MGYRWSFYARAQEREDWPELLGSDVHGVFFSWIKNVLLLREKGFVQSPELAPNPDPFQLEAAPCVLHFLSQPIFLLSLSHCSILFLLFCLHWVTLFS